MHGTRLPEECQLLLINITVRRHLIELTTAHAAHIVLAADAMCCKHQLAKLALCLVLKGHHVVLEEKFS